MDELPFDAVALAEDDEDEEVLLEDCVEDEEDSAVAEKLWPAKLGAAPTVGKEELRIRFEGLAFTFTH